MVDRYYGLEVHTNHYDRAMGFKVRPVKDKKNIPGFNDENK